MSVAVAGSLVVAAAATPAAAQVHPNFNLVNGGATVTPATNLVNGQKVTVKIKGFKTDTTLYVAECNGAGIEKNGLNVCDTRFVKLTGVKGGKATTPFTIRAGAGFKATEPSAKCGYTASSCLIVVADSLDLKTVNLAAVAGITFKDTRAATKTKVASKKKVAVHKTLVIRAVTTHAKGTTALTGTVTFYDNGKKIGAVKEKASGKVSLKHKFKKAGKQHIVAKYSGNKAYKPSKGKATVTVKK
jgi:Bacterial Ig-like domain (group 3)